MSEKIQISKALFNEVFDSVANELDKKIRHQSSVVTTNANYKDIEHYRSLEKREEALRSLKKEWEGLK